MPPMTPVYHVFCGALVGYVRKTRFDDGVDLIGYQSFVHHDGTDAKLGDRLRCPQCNLAIDPRSGLTLMKPHENH